MPTPGVFGLHMNAGITRDLQNTKNLFNTMLLLQGGVSSGDSAQGDALLFDIATDVLGKVIILFSTKTE